MEGAPKSVPALPSSRSTTFRVARLGGGGAVTPDRSRARAYRGAYATRACSASSSPLALRHHPGQSIAPAKVRCFPISRYTAIFGDRVGMASLFYQVLPLGTKSGPARGPRRDRTPPAWALALRPGEC